MTLHEFASVVRFSVATLIMVFLVTDLVGGWILDKAVRKFKSGEEE